MALSNIFREPRREITESAIGLGIFAVVAYFDYVAALWLEAATVVHDHSEVPWPLGMLVLPIAAGIAVIVAALILTGTHALGEAICNALERQGVHLRPRRRR